jgi:hypothetical protein
MKILTYLTTLSLLSGVSAASTNSIAEKTPTQTPPCQEVMFELYGELLYLQPNGSDLYYGVEAFPFDHSIALPIVSPN